MAKCWEMSLIHRNYFPFSPEPITEIRTSKLRLIRGEREFPWSAPDHLLSNNIYVQPPEVFHYILHINLI